MSKRGADSKAVSFKLPRDMYEIIHDAAVARGVDLSSILISMLAQNLPQLVRAEAQREAAMKIAKTAGLADAIEERLSHMELEEGGVKAGQELHRLLARLQEAYSG